MNADLMTRARNAVDRMASAHESVVGPLTEPEMLDPEFIAAGCIDDLGTDGALLLIDIAKETVPNVNVESDESFALQMLLAESIARNPWQITTRLCDEFTAPEEKRFLIRTFAYASSSSSSKFCTPSICRGWLVAEWNARHQYDENTVEWLRQSLLHLRTAETSELLHKQ